MSLISQDYMERYQGELDTAIKDYVSRHSAVNLSDQKDVAVNNPANGQVLKWNASLGKWVNANESGGGGGGSVNSLGDIGDIALGTLKDGQIIKWDADAQVWVNGDNESGGKTYIGTCTTAAATAAKEATVDSDFQLVKGVTIGIKFSNSNTASNCTLNVNNTGAKSIYYNTVVYTGNSIKVCGCVDRYVYYTYDGNYWAWLSHGNDDDTIYSAMTDAEIQAGTSTTARLITPKAFRANIDNKTWVGTCTTAAATAAKVVTVDTGFLLVKGARIAVKFSNTNTASNCTLNVNSTGAKSVYYNNAVFTGSSNVVFGVANRYHYYVYDGTYWVWDSQGIDYDTQYTPQSLGFGFGTCTTAAATVEKAVTLANYNLVTNGYVSVKFTNAVPASATMNINSKGAKAIYYKGAAITANIIGAGDLATFIYNGSQYHLVGIDKAVEGGITSYPDLSNKPSINSVTLSGNKTLNDLGIMPKPTYLTQTLTAGNTSVTFTNSAIASNSYVSVYTNVAGLNYTSLTVGTGTITITFPAQSANITVALEIKNV